MEKIYKPWIHENVIKMLEEKINKDTKILEFGSGYSTLFFQNLANNLTSIEHNDYWYNKIKPLINDKTNYILKSINYISKPCIDKKFYNCDTIEELLNKNISDEYYDIIMIDGIHRVNCAFGSYKKLKKGGILILDDTNRIDKPTSDGSYKPIQDLLKDWKCIKNRSKDRNTDYWIKPL